MTDVFFEMLSPLPLNRQRDARRIFQLWADTAVHLLPNRWGLHYPVRHPFTLSALEESIRCWEHSFYLKRTISPKLKSTIHIQHGAHRTHGIWTIGLNNLKDFDPAFSRLLELSSVTFSADFGFVHRITDKEISRGKANGSISFLDSAHTEASLFLSTHDLKRCLPDLYWTTVFGRPYVELFSRERLLSCPAYRVKELENGSVIVQLTPELKDIVAEEASFERVRQQARNHLDTDVFFDLSKGVDHRYRVPEFVWEPIVH